MNSRILSLLSGLAVASLGSSGLYGQAVRVTVQLDTNTLAVGQTTTLRVWAQVTPNLRPSADRIFSWYIDLLDTNGAAAVPLYSEMEKGASDNDPPLSSTGTGQGFNRLGIYDTFLNRPGAGVSNAVELLAVPVRASAPGRTRFSVRAGTGVSGLDNDFLVAPLTGGDPWTGGDYDLANADLLVGGSDCVVHLRVARLDVSQPGARFALQFDPCPGRTHTVESRSAVEGGSWQPLPNPPHNSGTVIVTNTLPHQFFRVRID